MCGRYTLYDTAHFRDAFRVDKNTQLDLKDNYNVSPGQYMPVITSDGIGKQLSLMKWGFIPPWTKDISKGYKPINAKSETAFESPMWRSAILHHRCLVPSHGFYEWQVQEDGKTKVPYFIYPKYNQLFSFAGLYSTWKDVEGKDIQSFTIMSTEPNKEMAPIHDRMPVILTPGEETNWLSPHNDNRERLEPLLHPYHDNGLEMYKVSSDVNSPRNNDKNLVQALI